MYSDEDVLVAKLRREYDDTIWYANFDEFITDLPILERLGYISFVEFMQLGDEDYTVKVRSHRSFTIRHRSCETKDYGVFIFIKNGVRNIIIEHHLDKPIAYISRVVYDLQDSKI